MNFDITRGKPEKLDYWLTGTQSPKNTLNDQENALKSQGKTFKKQVNGVEGHDQEQEMSCKGQD